MQIPTWLKILVILFVASVVFTILGALSPYVIGPVIIVALIVFPGRDPERPTLVKVVPWIWAFEILASVFLLAIQWMGKSAALSDDVRPPSDLELWLGIVLGIPLIWSLLKQNRYFRPLLIGSTAVFVGLAIYVYIASVGDLKAVFELVGSLLTQAMITGYLLTKVRPEKGKLAQQQEQK